MPKKGVFLPPKAVHSIKTYLAEHQLTQEAFATKTLKVSVKTFNNWLAGRSAVDSVKLELIIKELGIGIEDFFGEQIPEEYRTSDDVFPTLRLVYETGVALSVRNAYHKVAKLFWKQISFNKFPKTGYFQVFEHDVFKGKNYYCQVWLIPEEPVEEVTFTFSFTIFNLLRITYGEVILKKDCVEIKQYYQPPNYAVSKPKGNELIIKAATWFDEANHTFIVSSPVKFRLENKGRVSEMQLKHADNDIAVFWKHFFFHTE
jgi:transcriptional regulator with XRE-family HTH domain